MLDLKELERDSDQILSRLRRRGDVSGISDLLDLVKERKTLIAIVQREQEERNSQSKALSFAAKEEIDSKRIALRELGQRIKEKEEVLRQLEDKIEDICLRIPNPPRDDVPSGYTDSENIELRQVLKPPQFAFPVRDHVEIGQLTNTIDLQRAAKVSGARFAFLRGAASRLNRALIQYFTDFHLARGDTELSVPYLVREPAMVGTGQLPNLKEDAFSLNLSEGDALYLIPTAEVPVTNYYADEILEEKDLPERFCAYSACFRAEAGAAGKDTRGLVRMHQFEKVEMVRFATPAQADAELEAMTDRASQMLKELCLPHRIVEHCAGDLSFSAEKGYDIEVWLPGQNTYREISSLSSFGTFQARRAKIRYRLTGEPGKKAHLESVVTLNGSGLPLGRTIVAIYENHQLADGSVEVPEVLWPYMGGMKIIPVTK